MNPATSSLALALLLEQAAAVLDHQPAVAMEDPLLEQGAGCRGEALDLMSRKAGWKDQRVTNDRTLDLLNVVRCTFLGSERNLGTSCSRQTLSDPNFCGSYRRMSSHEFQVGRRLGANNCSHSGRCQLCPSSSSSRSLGSGSDEFP